MKRNVSQIQNTLMKLCDISPKKLDYEQPRKLAYKKKGTVIKVIGITRKDIFSLPQYQIQPGRMPAYSSMFERSEMPATAASASLLQNNLMISNSNMFNHIKSEGLPVISLSFNPYECDTELKKQAYKKAMGEIGSKKEKFKNLDPEQREKMELIAIQKEWALIAKKEIPKMWKAFQKNRSDLEQNNKRILNNITKDVKKKHGKLYKGAKECQLRAKRLQREMLNYWRKKDKEIQELKRKRDKAEKEIKKKQDEERESMLQKKRLEFIMRKSEIYTHFMAKKLGVADAAKAEQRGEVEIDEKEAEKAVMDMIKNREKEKKQYTVHEKVDREDETRLDTVDASMSTVFKQPGSFKGSLKEYQIKGLRWLDSLYQQGINGILADEMGLGKTIQAISLLAHVSENKNDWGPFCIVAPSTTLHNWKNEIERFCPHLRVMPYWGTFSERKALRKFFNPKHLSMPYSPFHVVITSYQLIALDEKYFKRPKWHYMILDEAQAIKNFNSQRWGVLLSFEARNRLLLTGTPIQNSMAELWALLHFIMPDLFDSHDQFQEWFSKDIEAHCQNEGELNKRHLERLHKVLKPFMLRRVKKDVENELGPKKEYNEFCEMTYRQKILYKQLKNKVKGKNIQKSLQSKNKLENLMNLVMQLRKVCNHPELLKPKETQSPLQLCSHLDYNRDSVPVTLTGINTVTPTIYKEIFASNSNPVVYNLPKSIYDECFGLWSKKCKIGRNSSWYDISNDTKQKFFNIYSSERVYNNTFGKSDNVTFNCTQMRSFTKNAFSVHLLFGLSFSNIEYLAHADSLLKCICMLHFLSKNVETNKYHYTNATEADRIVIPYGSMLSQGTSTNIVNHTVSILDTFTRYNVYDLTPELIQQRQKVTEVDEDAQMQAPEDSETKIVTLTEKNNLEVVRPLVLPSLLIAKREITNFNKRLEFVQDMVVTWPVNLICDSSSFTNYYTVLSNNIYAKQLATIGKQIRPSHYTSPGKLLQDKSTLLPGDPTIHVLNGFEMAEAGGSSEFMHLGSNGYSQIQVPDFRRLINDCGKMGILDKLLKKLFVEKHRCLIFCQMTKMMDIIEEYLSWMQYSYFRMDGSTQINDRRDMVDEFQKNDNIFCFLLSTRAGGLGVTLTGADTVIFYDNDWNPTMDAQATDRAHRIGQTKEVSVYRLITRHTVEENIVKRAKQKENVQSTVYAGGALRADTLKPSELVGFLVDEENEDAAEPGAFIKTKKRGRKAGEKPGEEEKHEGEVDEAKKTPTAEAHKIQYHYMNNPERNLQVNHEDEERAKEALKLLKTHHINEDQEEDDNYDVNEEFKDLLEDDNIDEDVKLEDEEENMQIEEDE